jgi:hypothetical protein
MREEFLFPVSRPERIRAVQELLGQEASWEDAERVLEVLQKKGYRVVRDLERYPYNTVIYPELDERDFWDLVEEVLG